MARPRLPAARRAAAAFAIHSHRAHHPHCGRRQSIESSLASLSRTATGRSEERLNMALIWKRCCRNASWLLLQLHSIRMAPWTGRAVSKKNMSCGAGSYSSTSPTATGGTLKSTVAKCYPCIAIARVRATTAGARGVKRKRELSDISMAPHRS
jgi:hypothetical protein